MKKYFFLLVLILTSSFLYSAGKQDQSDSLHVITSTSIIDDVVRQVAGDSVLIHNLMPKGHDPHSYEPTPRDMARVERADLVFTNGLGLEENLLTVVETVHRGEIIEVSQTIDVVDSEMADDGDKSHDHSDHEHSDHDAGDPHTWMSPLNVLRWVDVIEASLIEADPSNRSLFERNARTYRAELKDLDLWIKKELDILPVSRRILVTDHNVFSYFARDYHFKIIGTIIPGFSSSAEPSAGDISRLIAILEKEQLSAVFIGESAGEGTRKLAETLGEESKQSIAVYQVLTGALSKEGEQGDSYIEFMKYNVNQIISGLSE